MEVTRRRAWVLREKRRSVGGSRKLACCAALRCARIWVSGSDLLAHALGELGELLGHEHARAAPRGVEVDEDLRRSASLIGGSVLRAAEAWGSAGHRQVSGARGRARTAGASEFSIMSSKFLNCVPDTCQLCRTRQAEHGKVELVHC